MKPFRGPGMEGERSAVFGREIFFVANINFFSTSLAVLHPGIVCCGVAETDHSTKRNDRSTASNVGGGVECVCGGRKEAYRKVLSRGSS